jgi:hypothetical protein
MSKNSDIKNIDSDISEEAETECNIIKYALSFLIANLDDDILDDVSDILYAESVEELEFYLQSILDNY